MCAADKDAFRNCAVPFHSSASLNDDARDDAHPQYLQISSGTAHERRPRRPKTLLNSSSARHCGNRPAITMAVNTKPSSRRLDSQSKTVKRKRDQETSVAVKVHKKPKSDAAPVSGKTRQS